MVSAKPLRKATERPSHPDGQKYKFNCCTNPAVWKYTDGEFRCMNCGHDWTQKLTES